ncbi:unnamed protein product [Didymodactylos carnosus]|uniref:Uncharacterized protein n=1 Tax=Didymodactylos carnosus TaxID=1234261 RepID=A0A815XMB8_9BILA|nr:unnamed protein product [Didymodactylos carnosus]CAF4420694.1 unnamed protein product [Didymodactylos carnosus]
MPTRSQMHEMNERSGETVDAHNIYIDAEQSSFEEVANIIPNTDDREMLCLTFRSWLIGLVFTCGFTVMNQYYYYASDAISFDPIFVLLLSYPFGISLAYILPKKTIKIWNWHFSLNPGKFTIKEHVLVYSMASSSFLTLPYALAVFDTKRVFTKETVNFAIGTIFIISTQLMGLGIAGIMRRVLVWPSSLIWPGNLPSIALFRALHKQSYNSLETLKMGRLRFFIIAALCQSVYYWLPGYIMPVLAAFSSICMTQPSNSILSQLTGVNSLAMGSLVLDWQTMTVRILSPIVVPQYAQINILCGFIIFVWILTPILYYTNIWNSKMFPIASNKLYDSNGNQYDLTAILDKNSLLNETAYGEYGPFYMSTSRTLSYGIRFAWLSSLVIHTVLYHGKDIWRQCRTSLSHRDNDIHCKLTLSGPG